MTKNIWNFSKYNFLNEKCTADAYNQAKNGFPLGHYIITLNNVV